MVADGSFREDLYYRLNVVNIAIPPLRERKEDIPVMVNYFIKKYCTSMSRDLITIDQAAMQRLEEYHFPGNVRELENMIERAIVVGNGKEIRLKDLPLETNMVTDSNDSLDELEKKYIQKTLEKYDWNISRSAKALQIDRVTLYNKIKKYQLSSPKR